MDNKNLDIPFYHEQLEDLVKDLVVAMKELRSWVCKLEDWKGEDPPVDIVDAALLRAKKITE